MKIEKDVEIHMRDGASLCAGVCRGPTFRLE